MKYKKKNTAEWREYLFNKEINIQLFNSNQIEDARQMWNSNNKFISLNQTILNSLFILILQIILYTSFDNYMSNVFGLMSFSLLVMLLTIELIPLILFNLNFFSFESMIHESFFSSIITSRVILKKIVRFISRILRLCIFVFLVGGIFYICFLLPILMIVLFFTSGMFLVVNQRRLITNNYLLLRDLKERSVSAEQSI